MKTRFLRRFVVLSPCTNTHPQKATMASTESHSKGVAFTAASPSPLNPSHAGRGWSHQLPGVCDRVLTQKRFRLLRLSLLLDDQRRVLPLRDGRQRSAIESSEELDQRR